jgi:hypothetical protein
MGTVYSRLSFVHNLLAMETFAILNVTLKSFRPCRNSGSQIYHIFTKTLCMVAVLELLSKSL